MVKDGIDFKLIDTHTNEDILGKTLMVILISNPLNGKNVNILKELIRN